MNSSLYPDGVLVDRSALRRTELTKAAEILRDRTTLSSRGVFSGGVITVGTPNTTINVAQLSGYAPNGEFIETAGATLGISLDDYTPGVVNYVLAVYTEINDKLQPHESDGNTYATRSRPFYRIRIYSSTNYAALAATDANLANDARDRALIIGTVLGAATVVSANISMPIVYSNIMTSTPSDCVSITGVTVSSVSPATSEGSGTLTYVYPGNTITWTPPGGTVGAAVTLSSDAVYTVYDSGGIGGGVYLNLSVVYSQLPTTVGTITETLVIDNIYAQSIPRVTAEDWLHRNLIGTGIITENNPHGLSIDDLAGETLGQIEEHQDVMHCNGIFSPNGKSTSSFLMSINTALSTGDILNIVSPSTTDLYYINGNKLSSATGTSIDFAQANFTSGAIPSGTTPAYQGIKTYDIYVNDVGAIFPVCRFEFPVTRTISGVWIIDSNIDHPAGSFNLKVVVGAPGSTYTFTYGSGTPVVIDQTIPVGDPEGVVIRLYAQSGYDWIDLYVNRSVNMLSSDDRLDVVTLGSHTDSITVSVAPDIDQNMRIGTVVYRWTSATGGVGLLGWIKNFLTSPDAGSFLDHRPFGTLCKENLSDDLLQDVIYNHNDELHHSGVLLNRDSTDGTIVTDMNFGFEHLLGVGLGGLIRGGSYYLRGERKQKTIATTLTFPISSTCIVYLNTGGAVTYLNVTASSVQAGLAYLVGSSLYRNPLTIDYVSDDGQYSERGIPLYVVTTNGSTILTYRDVMRNINGPVDEWSVADRSEGLAAFNSLYSSFLWADTLTSTTYFDLPRYDTVNVKLTGLSSVDTTITQSAAVNVYGNRNQVNFTAVPSTGTSMWVLGVGCVVEGVRAVSAIAGTHFIFHIGDRCRVENCYYNSGVYNVGFATEVTSSTSVTISNVKVRNCESISKNSFVRSSALCGNSGWEISGNNLTMSDYTSNTQAISLAGRRHEVHDNTITIGNSVSTANFTTGILISGVSGLTSPYTDNSSKVYNNKIYSGMTCDYAINLQDMCKGVAVYGNRIQVSALGLDAHGYGIYGSSDVVLNNADIRDNSIESLLGGIYLQGFKVSDPPKNLSICNNKIVGSADTALQSQDFGIYLNVAATGDYDVTNLSITGNTVGNLLRTVYGTVSVLPVGYDVVGICVRVEGHSEIVNAMISGNSIYSITSDRNANNYAAAGIYVVTDNYHSGPKIQGLDISNNNISDVGVESGVSTDLYQYGIRWDLNDTTTKSLTAIACSLDNNNIKISPSSLFTRAYGIVVSNSLASSTLKFSSISNNGMRVAYGTSPTVGTFGDGIYLFGSGTTSDLSVCGNNIFCDTFGIYLQCSDSDISNNKITSGGVGIYGFECNRSTLSGNKIDIVTVNPGLIAAGSGSWLGCYGIFINGLQNDFTISRSKIKLTGSSNVLADHSANVNINGCERYSIDGVKTSQSYTTTFGGVANLAYHLYLYLGTLESCLINVDNCTLDNRTGVPQVRSDETSHALYFAGSDLTPADYCSGSVSVTNNTIYWPKESAGCEWRTTGAQQLGALAVRSPFSAVNSFSFIRFLSNKVVSKYETVNSGKLAPVNAWFATTPIFAAMTVFAGPVLETCYSNTYTWNLGAVGTSRTIITDWSLDNVGTV